MPVRLRYSAAFALLLVVGLPCKQAQEAVASGPEAGGMGSPDSEAPFVVCDTGDALSPDAEEIARQEGDRLLNSWPVPDGGYAIRVIEPGRQSDRVVVEFARLWMDKFPHTAVGPITGRTQAGELGGELRGRFGTIHGRGSRKPTIAGKSYRNCTAQIFRLLADARRFAGIFRADRSVYGYLKVMDARYALTRRAVSALPSDQLDFRPAPEMMSARELVLHLMGNYSFLSAGMGENDWTLDSFKIAGEFRSTDELVSAFDELYQKTRKHLEWFPDDGFELRVKPFGVEQKISSIVQGIAEHEIHHRGQLSVYLRLVGVQPPGMHNF